jgi:hypothetical protein
MRYCSIIGYIFIVGLLSGCRGDGTETVEDAGDTGDTGADAGGGGDPDSDTGSDSDTPGDTAPEVKVCGGSAGNTCDDDEYCAYAGTGMCGADGETSTCEVRPRMCMVLEEPVCGCDGNTYENWCKAASAGWGYLSSGACE